MASVTPPVFKPFTLTLIQLGSIGSDKASNLQHAREMVMKAAKDNSDKPQIVVLPECFNSPYGFVHFPTYAENIGYTAGKDYDIQASVSESVKMLSSTAKEAGIWLIGGSIPERDAETNKIYNTCTVYSPTGALVASHRKVHLFDIDIPGKITFKESETLTGGTTTNYFDTGTNFIHSACAAPDKTLSRICTYWPRVVLRRQVPGTSNDCGTARSVVI
jgi:omega-amidase